MSDPQPKLLSLRLRYGVAGQVSYLAEVDYGGEKSQVQFIGSAYGTPGTIIMIVNDNQTFVQSAGRFGERFGRKWVENFFGGGSDGQ